MLAFLLDGFRTTRQLALRDQDDPPELVHDVSAGDGVE
jgi:hypothetical protein